MSVTEFTPDPSSPLDPESQWEDFQNQRAFEHSQEREDRYMIEHGQGRLVVEGDRPFQGGALDKAEFTGQDVHAEAALQKPEEASDANKGLRIGNLAIKSIIAYSPILGVAKSIHRRASR
ncbi:MAG TPA: hypothetical protein VF733_04710 [Candidatus Saccharimonadales bacterium]